MMEEQKSKRTNPETNSPSQKERIFQEPFDHLESQKQETTQILSNKPSEQYPNVSKENKQSKQHKKIKTQNYQTQTQKNPKLDQNKVLRFRAKTMPKTNIKKDNNGSFLPELSASPKNTTNNQMKEKVTKLRELYEKKNKLYKKLQIINRRMVEAKIDMSIRQLSTEPQHKKIINDIYLGSPIKSNNQINEPKNSYSKSYSNSRNYNYQLPQFNEGRKKKLEAESISSVERNREVISFIKKMHEQSIKRDLNRIERCHQQVQHQLSHVCLECSRSKCQADVLSRVLKDSRAV